MSDPVRSGEIFKMAKARIDATKTSNREEDDIQKTLFKDSNMERSLLSNDFEQAFRKIVPRESSPQALREIPASKLNKNPTEETTAKRKPGRPRKNKREETTKRKPGRPRKIQKVETPISKREVSDSARRSSRRKTKICCECGTSNTTLWRKISKDSKKFRCDMCAQEHSLKKRKQARQEKKFCEDNEVPVDSLLLFSSKPLVDPSAILPRDRKEKKKKKKIKKKEQKIKKKRGRKRKKRDEEKEKVRKEILNVRMKKLKSRFENVFKFRFNLSENDESCLQWCSCTVDEDGKWQEVCGKKRECGRSTCTFCAAIKIEEKKKVILNDSLDDFTSSSDERNNPKKEKNNEEVGKEEEEDEVWKDEYTIAVRNILFTNISLGKPNGKQFWVRVKEHLISLFPEIELSASEIRTQWTLRSQDKIRNPEEKKEKKKSNESIKLANKGTLKRRKQIRAKIEELEADHVDDVFGEGGIMLSPKSRKFVNIVVDSPQLPSSLDECNSPANSSIVASPDIDLLRPVNHSAYDAYIYKRDRDFRQGRRKETKAKKKIKKGTTSSQKKRRRVNDTVSAMSRDLSGRTIRGCVTPSGTTKIKYQNEDDSFESFDGTNNNSMISESDISDIALTPLRRCPSSKKK